MRELHGRDEGGSVRPTQDESDRDLIWSALLEERPRAERVARARCSNPQDAEDCVQEAMARVVAMDDVDAARVGPLLATVTANLAADSHRGRARAARAEPRLRAALLHEQTPEEAVCDAAEARWLWQRTEVLAAQDRTVLALRAQGRSAAETAQVLGLTYKAAESAYTRARSKMRAVWRATAAALGILWGRPPRRPAEPAAAAAAVVALALVLLPSIEGEAAVPPPPSAQASVPSVAPRSPAPSPVASPSPDAIVARDPSGPAEPVAATPRPSQILIRSRPLVVDRTSVGATAVGRERPEETLGQTLERCLSQGLILTPGYIDCAG
jgi:RNA polymerase sigma factor (sigma-70 family)